MAEDMENHIRSCERCICFKQKPQKAELNPILTTHPLELIHVDYLTIESGKANQDINVLVVTDHFMHYSQAFITPSQTARVTAQTLWEKYFVYYGFPEMIISDQGRNFESKLIAELCEMSGVKKLCTTPYHPQSNGSCKQFNSTLINMLGTLPKEKKANWKDQLATLVHVYNCTRSTATGFCPYYLMYGRQPKLPIDILFGVNYPDLSSTTLSKYVDKLHRRLKWAYEVANEFNLKEIKRHKAHYNRNIRSSKLETGDLVLVHQQGFRGKHKIQDRWENKPYVVIDRPYPDMPVYKVQLEDGDGKPEVLHRNLLFPLLSRKMKMNDADNKSSGTTCDDSSDEEVEDYDSQNESYINEECNAPTGPVTWSMSKAKKCTKKSATVTYVSENWITTRCQSVLNWLLGTRK